MRKEGKMKQKLYFARHGATNANKERRTMGCRIDEPLNDEGRRDAYVLAISVPKEIEVIVSSPLKRARQTADIIGQALRLPIIECNELRERDMGTLSGKLWSDIEVETCGTLTLEKLRGTFEIDFSPWGGETKGAVQERLRRFLLRAQEEWKGKRVLAVCHAGVMRVCFLLAGYTTPPHVRNGGLYELEI